VKLRVKKGSGRSHGYSKGEVKRKPGPFVLEKGRKLLMGLGEPQERACVRGYDGKQDLLKAERMAFSTADG